MGFFKMRMKCPKCGEEWNSFFCSVNMSHGAYQCPVCKTEGDRIADDWKDDWTLKNELST